MELAVVAIIGVGSLVFSVVIATNGQGRVRSCPAVQRKAAATFVRYKMKQEVAEGDTGKCDSGGEKQDEVVDVKIKSKKGLYKRMKRKVSKRLRSKPRDLEMQEGKQVHILEDGRHDVDGRLSFPHSDECPICLEGYKDEAVLLMLSCGHVFHEPCAAQWLDRRSTCPCCKQDLNKLAARQEREAREAKARLSAETRPFSGISQKLRSKLHRRNRSTSSSATRQASAYNISYFASLRVLPSTLRYYALVFFIYNPVSLLTHSSVPHLD
ncbi:unnamed protein product [Chrysoparadoxa australica]